MIRSVVFDLNGTLLDLSALDPSFQKMFGYPHAREQWFERLQVLWMAGLAINEFVPFDKLADAALEMVAERENIKTPAAERKAVVKKLTALPAFPDVPDGLRRLKASGLRVAVLTNGSLASAREQVQFAGLTDLLDDVLSVETVKRYKPAPEPYLMAAEHLGLPPRDIVLAAAHAWDVSGAASAGLMTAFIARPRQVLNPQQPAPDFEVADVNALADALTK